MCNLFTKSRLCFLAFDPNEKSPQQPPAPGPVYFRYKLCKSLVNSMDL